MGVERAEVELVSVALGAEGPLLDRLEAAERFGLLGAETAEAVLAADGVLVSELARLIARAPSVAPATRATPGERGLVAHGLAWLLTMLPGGLCWQLSEHSGAAEKWRGWLVLELRLGLQRSAVAWLLLPPDVSMGRSSRGSPRPRPWLEHAPVDVAMQLTRCELPVVELHGLAVGDHVVFDACPRQLDGAELRLAVGGGFFAATLNDGDVTIAAPWVADRRPRRAWARPQEDSRMGDESTLIDELELEIVIELGRLKLPVAQLTGLDTGDVLALGRPLVAPVELRVGDRLVARAELVDVDGEAGVRVVEVYD